MDAKRDHIVKYPDSPLRRRKTAAYRERDFLVFRLVPQVRKGETRRTGATTRRRVCADSDSRPTFAEDGHQNNGLENSTYAITRLCIFQGFLDLYRWGFHCSVRCNIGFAWRRDSSCVNPSCDEERLCVCNMITTTYLLLTLLLLQMNLERHDNC